MQRNWAELTTTQSDLLIVGGGIYGAWAAWEAALRGLSVVLLEQSDFGGATSANSQKIIHGGFRYLQSFDVKRMRESIRERRVLFRVAPQLVQRLPCLMPTYRGTLLRSKPVMAAALALNDVIGWDRNAGISDFHQRIPQGRILSREECLRLIPDLPAAGLTGGALWYDGQIVDSERLTLTLLRSAANAGASVFNYARVTELLREKNRIMGARVVDALTGESALLRARLVINTAGPWVDRVFASLNGRASASPTRWLKVVNLILRTPMAQGVALALPMPKPPRCPVPGLIFITPWQGRAIAGSTYTHYHGRPEDCAVSEAEISAFLEGVQAAYPALQLKREDVARVHVGLLPASSSSESDKNLSVRRHYQIRDYARTHRLEGLISIVGVKYTTARDVAVKAVELAFKKLGRVGLHSQSHRVRLYGGNIQSFQELFDEALKERPWDLSGAVLRQLIVSYGTAYDEVIRLIRENLIWAEPITAELPFIKAQVIYAVREEMAKTLEDVVFRRVALAAGDFPGDQAIAVCADLMAAELGWSQAQYRREISAVYQRFVHFRFQRQMPSAAVGAVTAEATAV